MSPSLPPTRPDTPAPSESDVSLMSIDSLTDTGAKGGPPILPKPPTSAKPAQDAFAFLLGRPQEGRTSSSRPKGSSAKTKKRRASSSPTGGPKGKSKSARYAQIVKEKVMAGTYIPTPKQLETFETKIRAVHADAEITYQDNYTGTDIWCPSCQSRWPMPQSEPYKADRFRRHYLTCSGKAKGTRGRTSSSTTNKQSGSAQSMNFFASLGQTSEGSSRTPTIINTARSHPPEPPTHPVPCTGITETVDPNVATYLNRASAGSGGSRAVHVIAKEIFDQTYSALNAEQKKEVDLIHFHEKSWRIDYSTSTNAVFATACTGQALVRQTDLDSDILSDQQKARLRLCGECTKILNDSRFRAAAKKPIPAAENRKFINTPFVNPKVVAIYAKNRGLEDILSGPKAKVSFLFAMIVCKACTKMK